MDLKSFIFIPSTDGRVPHLRRFRLAIFMFLIAVCWGKPAISSEPSGYRGLPKGTVVTYDTWSFKVLETRGAVSQIEAYKGQEKDKIRYQEFAGLQRYGDRGVLSSLDDHITSYDADLRFESKLGDKGRTAIRELFPLRDGGVAKYKISDDFIGRSTSHFRTWDGELKVLGREVLNLKGIPLEAFKIQRTLTAPDSYGGGWYSYNIAAQHIIDTLWIHERSGLVLKGKREWRLTRDDFNDITGGNYTLQSVRFPDGTLNALLPANENERQRLEALLGKREVQSPSTQANANEVKRLQKEISRLKQQNQKAPKQDTESAQRAQEALQVLGYYSGKIDGVLGVRSKLAISRWQKQTGYPETGEITASQITQLERTAIQHFASLSNKPPQVGKKTSEQESGPLPGTTGSGFFVSKLGHIITSAHVVSNCTKITVGDNANEQVSARILETDTRNDLALLRISSSEIATKQSKSLIAKVGLSVVPTATNGLLRSNEVELGEDVLVAGYPFGDIFSNTIKVTKGIVSASRGSGDDANQFQIDAAVQPGNSGGPIYDGSGNIIGVVISQLNKLKVAKTIGAMPENINFGVRASILKQFLSTAGLPTKWSERANRRSTKELALIAQQQTLMVICSARAN